MRRCGLAGLALALLLGGGAPADEKKADKAEAVKQEWKLLNGTWEAVSAVLDGKKMPAPKEKVTVTLRDGKYTVKQGDKVVAEGTGKIDPTTSPKSVDVTPSSGPDKGKTVLAIYEVKGDTQRVCFARPGKPRPKTFEAKKGSGDALYTHKRVKPRD
jgi:uncharacterized protein (TIGR03067 family)